jgi:hypothetical protein
VINAAMLLFRDREQDRAVLSQVNSGEPLPADRFLEADGVKTEEDAMRWSLNAAVQQRAGGKVYRNDEGRPEFRSDWAKLIREESQPYSQPTQPVSDVQHCAAIRRISDTLSLRFGASLIDGRLRYGTSQKAFNLYLKCLWRMRKAATPPHCPVDRIVLSAAGIDGAWTKCDSEEQYVEWINKLRRKAMPLCLAEWEYQVWLQGRPNS